MKIRRYSRTNEEYKRGSHKEEGTKKYRDIDTTRRNFG
jgi:hypothetical protein